MNRQTPRPTRRFAAAALLTVGVLVVGAATDADAQVRSRRSTSGHRRHTVSFAGTVEPTTFSIALW